METLWKGNILGWSWELCKRPTECRGCRIIMKKGNHRLRTVQPGKYYYYKQVRYYCQACGNKILNSEEHSTVIFNGAISEIQVEALKTARKRFIRPERKEE